MTVEYKTNKFSFICDTAEALKLNSITDKEVTKVDISINFGKAIQPEPIEIVWRTPANGAFSLWSPLHLNGGITPNWVPEPSESRAALGMPYQGYIDNSDLNCVSVYLSDVRTPVTLSSGVVEETGELEWTLKLFSVKTGLMKDYNAQLIIDERKIPFEKSVAAATEYWNGIEKCYGNSIPAAAYDAVYSTWYSYHQNITDKELLSELKHASELGLKTVIIDDGWQTEDSSRSYAYCGDWQTVASKIPDMADFVSKVHQLGMKVMLWYSVPFVGEHSEAIKLFENQFLGDIDEKLRTYVLDPRFPKVREYLVDVYERAVKDWDLDGFKLDFIDSFELTEFNCDVIVFIIINTKELIK